MKGKFVRRQQTEIRVKHEPAVEVEKNQHTLHSVMTLQVKEENHETIQLSFTYPSHYRKFFLC